MTTLDLSCGSCRLSIGIVVNLNTVALSQSFTSVVSGRAGVGLVAEAVIAPGAFERRWIQPFSTGGKYRRKKRIASIVFVSAPECRIVRKNEYGGVPILQQSHGLRRRDHFALRFASLPRFDERTNGANGIRTMAHIADMVDPEIATK